MNDTHEINVVVRGIDRLSGVIRDAVNKSEPSLRKLNDRFFRARQEASGLKTDMGDLAHTIAEGGGEIDVYSKRVDKLSGSISRLRGNLRGRLPSIFGDARDIDRSTAAIDKNTTATKKNADAQRQLFSVDFGLFVDDLIRGWRSVEKETARAGDTLKQQTIKNQKILADFDASVAKRRREVEAENIGSRSAVENTLGIREEDLRKGLATLSNDLDKFIADEKIKLKDFLRDLKRTRDSLVDPEDVKATKTTSQSVKAQQKKRDAQDRIDLIDKTLTDERVKEEAASRQRILDKRREVEEINRITLAGIEQGARERLAIDTQESRGRIQTFDNEEKQKRLILRKSQAEQLRDIKGLVTQVRAERAKAFDEFKKTGGADGGKATQFEIFGRKSRMGLDDFIGGIKGARQNLKEFEGDARNAQSFLSQLGASVGDATKGINNLINVRWTLLLSLVSTLATVVIELGAALVAVAASAIEAAGALGGALIAGAVQAIPVVGLLIVAFKQLSDAMKVVDLRQNARDKSPQDQKAQLDAQRAATERLADANYGLGQSIESVHDANRALRDSHEAVTKAEREQTDAITALATARREAKRGLVDADLAEKDAALDLQEAEQGVLDAKQELADFNKKQSQNTADLRDAQDAVREAQDRLKLARAQGDAVEIASASSALAVAEGNVSSISDQIDKTKNQQKDLELGVKRAQLTVEQDRVKRKRAAEDEKRTKQQGVDRNPAVIQAQQRVADSAITLRDATEGVAAAQRHVRDQQHSVVNAHRAIRDAQLGVADAADKMSAAQRNADTQFNKLSPAQKRFVLAMERFQKVVKDSVNPITDIIIDSFSRVLDSVDKILQDPAVQKALTQLAGSIADVADNFAKWLIKPETRRDIIFFINQASKNLPTIASAAGRFATALLNIAKIASPIFTGITKGIEGLGEKFDAWTEKGKKISPLDQFHHRETQEGMSRADRFFAGAGKHLHAWGQLAGSILRLLGALTGASAGSGLKMVEGMTRAFDGLADKINKNPKPIREFFERVRVGLSQLLPVLGKFAGKLLEVFTSKNLIDFTSFILLTVIPAILDVVKVLGGFIGIVGKVIKVLDDVTGIPIASTVGKWLIGWGLFYGIMLKLFPILKPTVPLVKALFFSPISSIGKFVTGTKKAIDAIRTFIFFARTEGVLATFAAYFPKLANAIKLVAGSVKLVAIAMYELLFTPPFILLAIAAIIAAIILLDRKFHFIRPIIRAVGKALKEVFEWAKDHWKLLVAILVAPFAVAVYLIIKHRDKIWNGIKAVFNWIKNNWKLLLAILTGPFGLAALAILKWKDTIIRAVKSVYNGIVGQFKKLPGALGKIFNLIPGVLKNALKGLGGIVKNQLDKIPGFKKLEKALDKIPGSKTARRLAPFPFDKGGTVPGNAGQPVQITAHEGEWILNPGQQGRAARAMGTSVHGARNLLFGPNTGSKSHYKDGGVVGGDKMHHRDKDAHPWHLSFGDLPASKRRERIVQAYQNGRIDEPTAKKAWSYWKLGPVPQRFPIDPTKGFKVQSPHYGTKDFLHALDTIAIPLFFGRPSSMIDMFRSAGRAGTRREEPGDWDALSSVAVMMSLGGKTDKPFVRAAAKIRPLRDGGIRYMPSGVGGEPYGWSERQPAIWLKDKNALVVGRRGMGHGNVLSYIDSLTPHGAGYIQNGNYTELALYPDGKWDEKTARWEIYARHKEDVTPAMVKSMQVAHKSDVYAGNLEGSGLNLVASAAGKTVAARTGDRVVTLPNNWRSRERGVRGRTPAIFYEDSNTLVVGRDGFGHADIIDFAQMKGYWPHGGKRGLELAYYPENGGLGGDVPARWQIYNNFRAEFDEKRVVSVLQKNRNVPVYDGPTRVAGKRLTSAERAKIATANAKFARFQSGREWTAPPKARGTGIEVSKAVSTARGNVGEGIIARMTGGMLKSGKGEGKGGTGKFDVEAGDNAIEVKTMSADSQKFQASPREGEIPSKLRYAKDNGLNPHLAYVVVDAKSGRAYVYSRNDMTYARLGSGGQKSGWTYHGFKKLGEDQLAPFRPGFKPQEFSEGGDVTGGGIKKREGHPVPIIAHAGEWVVNKMQQMKLAHKMGESVSDLKMWLFGTKGVGPSDKTKAGKSTQLPNGYELIPHEDEYGTQIWFLKMLNGQYAQVSARAAKRIQASNGHWFPDYINRYDHGAGAFRTSGIRSVLGFANGGVVSFTSASATPKSYASGGVVGGPVRTSPGAKTINVKNEFNVKSEGESDWNHIMELGAQKAQGSY